MRLPDFTQFTPDEKKAVLALLLLTGGGSLVLEVGRHRPQWTPDLKLVAAAARVPGATADSTRADSLDAPAWTAEAGGGLSPVPGDVGLPADAPAAVAPTRASLLAAGAGLFAGDPGTAPASAAAPAGSTPPDSARPGGGAADTTRVDARVDINHADAPTLATLPGIGPAMAGRILADRTANGLYRRVEDLLRVKGIGPAKLKKLRDHVVIRR